jgi:hypothetical protein
LTAIISFQPWPDHSSGDHQESTMSQGSSRQPALRWRHAFAALPLLWAAAAPAQAPAYVGKVCLINTVTVRETGPVTPQIFPILLDVTNLGANTYSVVGSYNDVDQPFIIGGTASIVAGQLYINMTATQAHSDGWMDTAIHQARLNLSTMQGTFYEIGRDYNTVSRQFDASHYTAGTASLSMAACQ